jgi:hypothetical protein
VDLHQSLYQEVEVQVLVVLVVMVVVVVLVMVAVLVVVIHLRLLLLRTLYFFLHNALDVLYDASLTRTIHD